MSMRAPTAKEKIWLDKLTRLLKQKPKTLSLHMDNEWGELHAYEGTYPIISIDYPSIKKFCSDGDPLI